ncbi:MAG: hypothetical protein ACRD22_00870, partial [Terriglobia bacterium]
CVAFLEWTAKAEHTRVRDGADSFVIEDAGSWPRPSTTPWNKEACGIMKLIGNWRAPSWMHREQRANRN